MLDKKVFLKCMNALLLFGSVEPDDRRNDMYYQLVANDFDDKQFSEICGDICKTENLYGKYPEPKLFYDRKAKMENTILIEVGAFYVDDTTPKYMAVLADLSEEKRREICDRVWDWLYSKKRGEFVSEDFIADRLKQFRPEPQEDFSLPDSLRGKLLGVLKTKKV